MSDHSEMPPRPSERVATVTDLVRAFGGTMACARWAGVRSQVVSNWKARGRIPGRLALRFADEASRRQIPLPRSLFERAA